MWHECRPVDENTDSAQHRGAECYRLAEDPGAPAVGPGQTDEHPHRRGLAGAVRTEQRADVSGRDSEAEGVDGLPPAVPLRDLFNVNTQICSSLVGQRA